MGRRRPGAAEPLPQAIRRQNAKNERKTMEAMAENIWSTVESGRERRLRIHCERLYGLSGAAEATSMRKDETPAQDKEENTAASAHAPVGDITKKDKKAVEASNTDKQANKAKKQKDKSAKVAKTSIHPAEALPATESTETQEPSSGNLTQDEKIAETLSGSEISPEAENMEKLEEPSPDTVADVPVEGKLDICTPDLEGSKIKKKKKEKQTFVPLAVPEKAPTTDAQNANPCEATVEVPAPSEASVPSEAASEPALPVGTAPKALTSKHDVTSGEEVAEISVGKASTQNETKYEAVLDIASEITCEQNSVSKEETAKVLLPTEASVPSEADFEPALPTGTVSEAPTSEHFASIPIKSEDADNRHMSNTDIDKHSTETKKIVEPHDQPESLHIHMSTEDRKEMTTKATEVTEPPETPTTIQDRDLAHLSKSTEDTEIECVVKTPKTDKDGNVETNRNPDSNQQENIQSKSKKKRKAKQTSAKKEVPLTAATVEAETAPSRSQNQEDKCKSEKKHKRHKDKKKTSGVESDKQTEGETQPDSDIREASPTKVFQPQITSLGEEGKEFRVTAEPLEQAASDSEHQRRLSQEVDAPEGSEEVWTPVETKKGKKKRKRSERKSESENKVMTPETSHDSNTKSKAGIERSPQNKELAEVDSSQKTTCTDQKPPSTPVTNLDELERLMASVGNLKERVKNELIRKEQDISTQPLSEEYGEDHREDTEQLTKEMFETCEDDLEKGFEDPFVNEEHKENESTKIKTNICSEALPENQPIEPEKSLDGLIAKQTPPEKPDISEDAFDVLLSSGENLEEGFKDDFKMDENEKSFNPLQQDLTDQTLESPEPERSQFETAETKQDAFDLLMSPGDNLEEGFREAFESEQQFQKEVMEKDAGPKKKAIEKTKIWTEISNTFESQPTSMAEKSETSTDAFDLLLSPGDGLEEGFKEAFEEDKIEEWNSAIQKGSPEQDLRSSEPETSQAEKEDIKTDAFDLLMSTGDELQEGFREAFESEQPSNMEMMEHVKNAVQEANHSMEDVNTSTSQSTAVTEKLESLTDAFDLLLSADDDLGEGFKEAFEEDENKELNITPQKGSTKQTMASSEPATFQSDRGDIKIVPSDLMTPEKSLEKRFQDVSESDEQATKQNTRGDYIAHKSKAQEPCNLTENVDTSKSQLPKIEKSESDAFDLLISSDCGLEQGFREAFGMDEQTTGETVRSVESVYLEMLSGVKNETHYNSKSEQAPKEDDKHTTDAFDLLMSADDSLGEGFKEAFGIDDQMLEKTVNPNDAPPAVSPENVKEDEAPADKSDIFHPFTTSTTEETKECKPDNVNVYETDPFDLLASPDKDLKDGLDRAFQSKERLNNASANQVSNDDDQKLESKTLSHSENLSDTQQTCNKILLGEPNKGGPTAIPYYANESDQKLADKKAETKGGHKKREKKRSDVDRKDAENLSSGLKEASEHENEKHEIEQTEKKPEQAMSQPQMFPISAPASFESTWFDKAFYDEAETRFFERLSRRTKPDQPPSAVASYALLEGSGLSPAPLSAQKEQSWFDKPVYNEAGSKFYERSSTTKEPDQSSTLSIQRPVLLTESTSVPAAGLALREQTWFDKSLYDAAETQHYEKLARRGSGSSGSASFPLYDSSCDHFHPDYEDATDDEVVPCEELLPQDGWMDSKLYKITERSTSAPAESEAAQRPESVHSEHTEGNTLHHPGNDQQQPSEAKDLPVTEVPITEISVRTMSASPVKTALSVDTSAPAADMGALLSPTSDGTRSRRSTFNSAVSPLSPRADLDDMYYEDVVLAERQSDGTMAALPGFTAAPLSEGLAPGEQLDSLRTEPDLELSEPGSADTLDDVDDARPFSYDGNEEDAVTPVCGVTPVDTMQLSEEVLSDMRLEVGLPETNLIMDVPSPNLDKGVTPFTLDTEVLAPSMDLEMSPVSLDVEIPGSTSTPTEKNISAVDIPVPDIATDIPVMNLTAELQESTMPTEKSTLPESSAPVTTSSPVEPPLPLVTTSSSDEVENTVVLNTTSTLHSEPKTNGFHRHQITEDKSGEKDSEPSTLQSKEINEKLGLNEDGTVAKNDSDENMQFNAGNAPRSPVVTKKLSRKKRKSSGSKIGTTLRPQQADVSTPDDGKPPDIGKADSNETSVKVEVNKDETSTDILPDTPTISASPVITDTKEAMAEKLEDKKIATERSTDSYTTITRTSGNVNTPTEVDASPAIPRSARDSQVDDTQATVSEKSPEKTPPRRSPPSESASHAPGAGSTSRPILSDRTLFLPSDEGQTYASLLQQGADMKPARPVFNAHACHVCKQLHTKQHRLKSCGSCRLVAYCSAEHQRAHWPLHRALCKVITRRVRHLGTDHLYREALNVTSPEHWKRIRFKHMAVCEEMLNRPMEAYEKEMFLYPRACDTCHETNPEKLHTCPNCHSVSYCNESHLRKNHGKFCKDLRMLLDIHSHQNRHGVCEPTLPDTVLTEYAPLPPHIREFLVVSLLGPQRAMAMGPVELAVLSDYASYPLTLLYALQNIPTPPEGHISQRSELTVHVVGAELATDCAPLGRWDAFLLSVLPRLRRLHVVFIGPELEVPGGRPGVTERDHTSPASRAAGKRLTCELQPSTAYHTYCRSPRFRAPDVICAFNAGLHRGAGDAQRDSWRESIPHLVPDAVPLVVTGYTLLECPQDVARVQQEQRVDVLLPPMKNPYRSTRPAQNFLNEHEAPIVFKNQYVACLMAASKARK